MKTVYLYGKLGKRFGKKWRLNASSPLEVFSAIDANSEGFLSYLSKTEEEGVKYVVLHKSPVDISCKEDLQESMVTEGSVSLVSQKKELHILPAVEGNATLFIALKLAKVGGGLTLLGKIVAAVAISFVVGAIMKALFKPPKRSDPTTTKSYLLKGNQNRQAQGVAVPVGYGRVKIGSSCIAQEKLNFRQPTKDGQRSEALESFSEITYLDLLSEGPVEGFVNQNGGSISLAGQNSGKTLDIREGVLLNNVPIKNTPADLSSEGTLNYILNEGGKLPDFKIGAEGERKIMSKQSSFVVDYDVLLYGAGPYTEVDDEAHDKTNQFRTTYAGAKKGGAKIIPHFIGNKNASKIRFEFNSTLLIQNDDGSTSPNNVRFMIMVEKDNSELNVLDPLSGCEAGLGLGLGELTIEKGGSADGHFMLSGIASGVYAFDVFVSFKRSNISSRGITFKVVKLSDEYDPSVKGGVGGIAKSRDLKLSSVSEYVEELLLYPHSAICKITFDSKNFSSLPGRAYHLKLKKVLIPSNYNPISRSYDGPWDGLFKGQADSSSSIHSISDDDRYWTDNPAWVFFDLVNSPRYGIGKYGLDEEHIDKWQLYRVAKYCDGLVSTEYPIETKSFTARSFSTPNILTQRENASGISLVGNSLGIGKDKPSQEELMQTFDIYIDSSQYRSASSAASGTQSSYSEGSFAEEFGKGESFKGKKVAFFIASRNTEFSGLGASPRLTAISKLKQRSVSQDGEIIIEERILVKSTPDKSGGGTITVTGPLFDNLSPSFAEGELIRTVGACAVQVNHPLVEPRFTSNLYITDKMEALTAINNMASIFRGITTYSAGKIMAVQDSFKNPVQLFNNSNVYSEGFSYSGGSKDQKITSSLVRFNNKDDNFKPDVVQEEDTDALQRFGFSEKETLGFGITSSSQARRLAKWVLYTSQLEVETVSFKCGKEASYLFPGSIFEVSDEMRVGKSKSGRVLGVNFTKKINKIAIVPVSGDQFKLASDEEMEVYSPSILLDKHMMDEPFVGKVELTVCVGLGNSTISNLEGRAPFERSVLDQDSEISSVFSPQILKFDGSIEYDMSLDEGGPQGQKVAATGLMLKLGFELSLSDNTFSISNHGLINGDRVSFQSEGSLPAGIDSSRRGDLAYYVIECTKHTFKVSASFGGSEINISNTGKDPLGNSGGLHYLCPEDKKKTEDALSKIMIGAPWSAKGLLASKTDAQLSADARVRLGVVDSHRGGWEKSSWLGWFRDYGDWWYIDGVGFLYMKLFDQSLDGSFWFYMGGTSVSSADSGGSYVWTNSDNSSKFWFVYWLATERASTSGWIIPYYSQDTGSIIQFFVYDSDLSMNVGDQYNINQRKMFIVGKYNGGGIKGYFVQSDTFDKKQSVSANLLTSSLPSGLGVDSSSNPVDLNKRRDDLVSIGLFKKVSISSFQAKSKSESLQGEDCIQITLVENQGVNVPDSQKVFIEDVSSDNSGGFDDLINVVYIYDPTSKSWTTSVRPWTLMKVNDFQFELIGSSSMYSSLASTNFTDKGEINFLSPAQSEAERSLEGQLFRTMSVKEGTENKYDVVGLEYNRSKFDSVDKRTVIRRPVLPIPPQADMSIPEAPDGLILTDLTR